MSAFDFGVGLFPTEPLEKMIHLAKVSEEVGFTHIWVGDSHLIWREAYVNMAAMALNTTKVKLGTGVAAVQNFYAEVAGLKERVAVGV